MVCDDRRAASEQVYLRAEAGRFRTRGRRCDDDGRQNPDCLRLNDDAIPSAGELMTRLTGKRDDVDVTPPHRRR